MVEVAMTESSTATGKFGYIYSVTLITAVIAPLAFELLNRKYAGIKYIAFASVLLSLGLWAGRGKINPDPSNNTSNSERNLYSSKWSHFVESTFEYFTDSDDNTRDVITAAKRFREHFGFGKTIDILEAPFSRRSSENNIPDWEEYIDIQDSMNIVIIFSEGLSSSFTGPEAHFGSLTPHLDSLINKGLYWPNMFSNTDRTHGIFSSAVSGLPHGFERGFLNLKNKYPDHISISKLLSNNNYSTAFAYGGWSHFDNYRPFMEDAGVEFYFDQDFLSDTFNVEPQTNNKDAHMWGFRDHRFGDLYFKSMDLVQQSQPYFNVLLTLSLHSPYNIPDEEYYFQKSVDRNPDFSDEFIKSKRKELAGIAYFDEFFKRFFDQYSKREDFKNTIFLIFGDHNIHTLRYKNELDKYHVPFLIYSEAIKKPAKFREIISHQDVPATISGLFKKGGIDLLPKRVHWLGKGVRLNDEPAAQTPIFFGSFTGELTGVLTGNKLLLHDDLYTVEDGMQIYPLKNQEVRRSLNTLMEDYKTLNRFVIEEDMIISSDSRIFLDSLSGDN